MDSMRSLNRSLPTSQSNKSGPPDQLLQSFKQAALSVTNLYKSAAADQESSRQAGYQDALDDLLKFLDRENIGVQDGEGWRIREWITARYDGGVSHQQSDSDDEASQPENRNRSSSPAQDTKHEESNQQNYNTGASSRSQVNHESYESSGKSPVFHFRSGDGGLDSAMQTDESKQYQDTESISNPGAIRVEVKNRSSNKSGPRNNNRNAPRPSVRGSNFNGATKRKYPFPDISEIFNVSLDKRDGGEGTVGGGGNKRGRLV